MNKYQEILKSIEKLNILELNELVEIFEKKFNIKTNNLKNDTESKNLVSKNKKFNIILTEIGANKISVIKIIREITKLGLKESKDIVDNLPNIIKKNLDIKEAEELKKKIESTGAKLTINEVNE